MQLQLKNISVYYGKVAALKGVSLELEAGGLIALIGSNGAGKTTLLKTISGINKPVSGEIWCSGERIDGLTPVQIVKMGISHIPEGKRIFPLMTVYENLLMGASLQNDQKLIKENLEKIYGQFPILRTRTKQAGGSLSGGEQQMLAVARGLMSNPKILLIDEPSTGLAPIIVEQIGVVISDINKTGVSVILVEQNVPMALSISSKGYVMQTGEIVLEGFSKDLLNNEEVKKAYLGR
jgi:branched-chain amino acid transport system ATP-binding protein